MNLPDNYIACTLDSYETEAMLSKSLMFVRETWQVYDKD